jgi:hypothetical protein
MKRNINEPLDVQIGPKYSSDDYYFMLDGKESLKQLNETGRACGANYQTEAYYGDFVGIETGINVREPFSRKNYDQFRPNEALPVTNKDILRQCDLAYRKVGLIKNIIDLMADFASQGISISHPVRRHEKLLNNWFAKAKGNERSERFINNLLRFGNVFVKRILYNLSKSEKKDLISTTAVETHKYEKIPYYGKGVFPMDYRFLDPLTIEAIAPELSKFVGRNVWGMRISPVYTHMANVRTEYERELLREIPDDIQKLMKTPNALMPLDPTRLIVAHYKKDDWRVWGDPLTLSILDDVILYQKAKLADMAILDGTKSTIRLFKLGNSEKGIYPKPAALSQLQNIMSANTGGGPVDLFWTDDISIEAIESKSYQSLGSAKYEPILTAIYDGLGIPTTLTSKGGGSNGFTNNALSLKTLVERLKYCRNMLTAFWETELRIVEKALGIKKPATVDFDFMDLSDDSARGTLLMNLADRGFISWETIMETLGQNSEVEQRRLKRESKDRAKNRLPKKAGPWHDPQQEFGLKKIALQSGAATPGQVGLKLDPPGPGELNKHEQTMQLAKTKVTATPKGQPNQGRPKTSKDKTKRKTRTPKVKKAVAEFLIDPFLDNFGVKDMLELSDKVEAKFLFLVDKVAAYLIDNELEVTGDNIIGAIECLS